MSLKSGGEYAVEAVKASPPVTVTVATVIGFGLQDWVLILTAIYTILQIVLLIRKTLRDKS